MHNRTYNQLMIKECSKDKQNQIEIKENIIENIIENINYKLNDSLSKTVEERGKSIRVAPLDSEK